MPEPVASKFPPKESLDWFKAKGLKPAFDYRDVWKEEHANAFMAADELKAAMEALGVAEAPKLQVFNKL